MLGAEVSEMDSEVSEALLTPGLDSSLPGISLIEKQDSRRFEDSIRSIYGHDFLDSEARTWSPVPVLMRIAKATAKTTATIIIESTTCTHHITIPPAFSSDSTMLRLIKERKLQQEEGLAGDTPLVSHIALPSKKATSVLFLGSCEGSLSSAQCHPFQSLARNNDDQTHDGDPQTLKATVTMGSSEASSSSVGAPRNGQPKTEIQALAHVTTESAVPRHHGFTRTISFVSGDIVNGTTAKRPRNATMWRQPSPTPSHSHSGLRLSTAKDSGALSPLHIFVRHQIEVFEASETDLKQPAPGRRIPIQLNQGK